MAFFVIKPAMFSFLRNRVHSFKYAYRGLARLLRTEPNFQVHSVAAVAVLIASWYFQLTAEEWGLIVLTIALVLLTEGINTAVEHLANYVQPAYAKEIAVVKDIAAGAVLLATLASVVVGSIVFGPKLWTLGGF